MAKQITNIFKKKLFWIILVIVIIAAIVVINLLNGNNKQNNLVLPTFKAQVSNLSDTIKLSGSVKTVFLTEVITKAQGIVTEVYVENGQQVKQGDKLFEIELSPDSKQQAQSAYNSYLSAKNTLQSNETSLYNLRTQLMSANDDYIDYVEEYEYGVDYDSTNHEFMAVDDAWTAAQENYRTAEDKVNIAKQTANTSYLNYQQYANVVTAPASGEVSGIAVTEGMMVTNTDDASQRLAVVKTGDTLLIQLDVNELDIGKVKVGQKADVVLTATGNTIYEGEVLSIDQIGTSTSGTPSYPVLIGFSASQEVIILPNMTADVTIKITDKPNVLAISTLAVQTDEDGSYFVDVVTGREGQGPNAVVTTEKRPVQIGLQTEDLTEIVSGLSEGDEVQMDDFNAMFGTGNDLQNMIMGGGPSGDVGGHDVRVRGAGG